MKKSSILFVLSLLTTLPLAGQPAFEPFIAFFKPLVGTWSCTVHEYDEVTGQSTWSEAQNREFASLLNGNYLQERAFSLHQFAEKQVGLFLYSFEPASGKVFTSGFWVGTAGQLFEIQGGIESKTQCTGIMKIRQKDGSIKENKVEWRWVSADEFRMTIFREGKKSSHYRAEELIYVRKS